MKQWKRLAALSSAIVMAAATLTYFPNDTLQNIRLEISASAEDASAVAWTKTESDGLTWTLYEDGTLNISGTGEMRGYNAYSIKSPACDNSNIKNVVIEDGITSIGSSAFYSCYSLTDITIPNGVTSIEDSTFRYCSNLTSITIPDSVTSIGSSVFDDCFFLKTISLRCGSTLKRSDFDDKANFVSYTPHTLTKTAAKTETCTEDGNIEHWTCKHCGKYFLSDDTNPELQHQWNSQKPSSLQVTS